MELNTDVCPICGSKEIAYSDSLHVWQSTFGCGYKIWGSFSDREIEVEVECPYKKDIKDL